MAQQIKVIDTNGIEHYHFIQDNQIYFSKDNDGLYRDSLENVIDNNLSSLSLSQVREAIDYHDWDLDDLGFEVEDYIDDDMLYDEISVAQHFSDVILEGGNTWELEELIKIMEKNGYTVLHPDKNEKDSEPERVKQ